MHTVHPLTATRPLTRLGALLLVVCAAALAGPLMSSASANTVISCSHGTYPTTCDITEPNVQQRMTSYPQIQLFAGDRVTVNAGGCVQTGGAGKTWKRFVDPTTSNSELGLYIGTVEIPGTTSGAFPLIGMRSKTLTVQRYTPLRIGYVDTNYSDNGYWGREGDDGTLDQCRGMGNAWVRVSIY